MTGFGSDVRYHVVVSCHPGKLSGWITVPVARNAWGGSGGGDDSDSDYGDEDIDDYLEAVLGSPGGMMAVASSPRVPAPGNFFQR